MYCNSPLGLANLAYIMVDTFYKYRPVIKVGSVKAMFYKYEPVNNVGSVKAMFYECAPANKVGSVKASFYKCGPVIKVGLVKAMFLLEQLIDLLAVLVKPFLKFPRGGANNFTSSEVHRVSVGRPVFFNATNECLLAYHTVVCSVHRRETFYCCLIHETLSRFGTAQIKYHISPSCRCLKLLYYITQVRICWQRRSYPKRRCPITLHPIQQPVGWEKAR